LVDLLLDIKGMCLLSGYDNDIYKPLEATGWKLKKIYETAPICKNVREECLWFSPNLVRALVEEGKWLEGKDK